MKILITGHTGFKGTWLSILLANFGHTIYGYSNEIYKNGIFDLVRGEKYFKRNNINDINDLKSLQNFVNNVKVDAVFHLAAQPIVSASYNDQFNTYKTNVMGTMNLLYALDKCESCEKIIIITSDKVYSNLDQNQIFDENSKLGGGDPYSNSKAMADLLAQNWNFKKNEKKIVILRAGNVIGPGDISKNRLLPDVFRSIETGEKLLIRNPKSVRPWQYVLDCVYGYKKALDKIEQLPNKIAINFGPSNDENFTVTDILDLIQLNLRSKNFEFRINLESNMKESGILKIDSNRAKQLLDWSPKIDINNAIKLICDWHEKLWQGNDAANLAEEYIKDFLRI